MKFFTLSFVLGAFCCGILPANADVQRWVLPKDTLYNLVQKMQKDTVVAPLTGATYIPRVSLYTAYESARTSNFTSFDLKSDAHFQLEQDNLRNSWRLASFKLSDNASAVSQAIAITPALAPLVLIGLSGIVLFSRPKTRRGYAKSKAKVYYQE